MSALAREVGCSPASLYRYTDWAGDHWQVWRYPGKKEETAP